MKAATNEVSGSTRGADLLTRVCGRMILFVARRRPELLVSHVMEKANEIAVSVTMAILDREGISHCRFCPQRFALRKTPDGYLCLNHSTKEVSAHLAG